MKVVLDERLAVARLRVAEPSVRRRIKAALQKLAEDPSGIRGRLDVKRLDVDAGEPMYRMRIGEWRIAFTVDRTTLVVLRIFHRSEGYGWITDMP